jgi:hypothetical protein
MPSPGRGDGIKAIIRDPYHTRLRRQELNHREEEKKC